MFRTDKLQSALLNLLDLAVDAFFEMLHAITLDFTLPTGDIPRRASIYATIIAALSWSSEFFGLPICFINWRGAVIAALILLALFLLERGVKFEILRLYRVAVHRLAVAKKRAARAYSGVKAGRPADADNASVRVSEGSAAGGSSPVSGA